MPAAPRPVLTTCHDPSNLLQPSFAFCAWRSSLCQDSPLFAPARAHLPCPLAHLIMARTKGNNPSCKCPFVARYWGAAHKEVKNLSEMHLQPIQLIALLSTTSRRPTEHRMCVSKIQRSTITLLKNCLESTAESSPTADDGYMVWDLL